MLLFNPPSKRLLFFWHVTSQMRFLRLSDVAEVNDTISWDLKYSEVTGISGFLENQ